MKLAGKTDKIFVIAIYIALLFAGANSLVYGHYHISENGRVIFHAHPYDTSNDTEKSGASHHHTSSEMLFYAAITHMVFIIVAALSFLLLYSPKIQYIECHSNRNIIKRFLTSLRLRAPPALV